MEDMVDYEEVLDTMTNDFITSLKTDTVLTSYDFGSEIGLNPKEDPPCFTIEFDDEYNGDIVHSGGFDENYQVLCRIIGYIPSQDRSTGLPSLNEFRQRIKKQLHESLKNGNLSVPVVDVRYKRSYKAPLRIPGGDFMETVAFMVIIEFEVDYEVSFA